MEWFTRDWATGQLSDEEHAARLREYAAHLNAVGRDLTNGAEFLIEENLHDAQIHGATATPASIRLVLLAGDLQTGYRRVEITYGYRPAVRGCSPADLSKLANPLHEVLYDEVVSL